MDWNDQQLAEALDQIRAIRLSIAVLRRQIQDISSHLQNMVEALEAPNGRMPLIEIEAPSICPTATP
jgi:hypothetical protein